nr:MAG TPA: hypothetical protein [Caudoviricetes sp.]
MQDHRRHTNQREGEPRDYPDGLREHAYGDLQRPCRYQGGPIRRPPMPTPPS